MLSGRIFLQFPFRTCVVSSMMMSTMEEKAAFAERLTEFQHVHQAINRELSKVIIGQRDVLDQMLASMFCGAHCLLVGVPGLAKTAMVKALAEIMALTFK